MKLTRYNKMKKSIIQFKKNNNVYFKITLALWDDILIKKLYIKCIGI